MHWKERLRDVGVARPVSAVNKELARSIENLGFGAIWLGGSPASALHEAEALLAATDRIVIATGVVNVWMSDADELAASYHRIEAAYPGRLLLGIGTGHRERTVNRSGPVAAMSRYLDVLDEHRVPKDARVLSALGPRMLELAAQRSAGTHPFLTVSAQTAEAREALGRDALIALQQAIVLDPDTISARRSAHAFLRHYLTLDNYVKTIRRAGFEDADIESVSDRLIDEFIIMGDAGTLADGVRAKLRTGVDHVCVQVVPVNDDIVPPLAALADALGLRG